MNQTRGDLEYLYISNQLCEAKIALQGAHIFHFQTKGKRPLLWLSESACFEKGKAIRGGVPICWPWFGAHPTDHTLPNHGFARTALWKHISTEETNNKTTKVLLQLKDSPESLRLWPYHFELTLEITLAHELSISLITKNVDSRPFVITDALHTYLAIENINEIYVDGLNQKPYYNKVDDTYNNIQEGRLYFKQETDRVYAEVSSNVSIHENTTVVNVRTEGSQTLVVWNPGEELTKRMPDLSDHKTMLCLESANALKDEVLLQPNKSHRLTSIITQG